MTDWPRIVSDLLATGLKRDDLAHEAEAGWTTLRDLRDGITTDPRHSLGVRLLALHAVRVGQLNDNNRRRRGVKSREVEGAKKQRNGRG